MQKVRVIGREGGARLLLLATWTSVLLVSGAGLMAQRGVQGADVATTSSAPVRVDDEDTEKDAARDAKATDAEAKKRKKQAERELVEAGKIGRTPRGTPTVERVARLEEAAGAFAQIEQRYAQQPEIVAEASFRRGELLGRLGRPDEAQAAFERSAGLSVQKWAARALYEAGNSQRRSKRWTKALECYRKAQAAADLKYATKAWLEVGKALLVLGRVPEAREELGKLARDPGRDVFERVRAFDELADSFLDEKRFEPAQEILAEVEKSFAEQTQGEDKFSLRLRKSIASMRARKKLARILGEGPEDGDGR